MGYEKPKAFLCEMTTGNEKAVEDPLVALLLLTTSHLFQTNSNAIPLHQKIDLIGQSILTFCPLTPGLQINFPSISDLPIEIDIRNFDHAWSFTVRSQFFAISTSAP